MSIESYEDIKNLKLVANKEFRGAKIGRLLVGSNLIEQSFANIDLLAIHVRENDEIDGGITDTTYLMQKFNDKDLIWEQLLGYSKLKSEYFSQLLLDLNKRASNDNGERIQSIIDMQSDYGTAEWEQYAVATSRNDNGVLLKHVNEAILSLRRSGELEKICDAEKYPYPKRLMGSHQEAEGSRRLASVIPLAPISLGVSDQKIIRPVVIGPSIDFEWKPIKSDQNNRYKLQISENKDFSSLLWSTTSSTNKIVVDPSTINKFSGVLYWRAKALGHTDEGNDTFPNDGWSNIVEFEYYKSVIDRLKITKKLLVAVNVSNGYSVFRDKNDKLAGFDVDLIGQLAINIASDLDIPKLEVVPVIMSFSEMFSAVQYYQVDMAISGITKKLAREKKYNIKFSHPYTTTRQAAIWSRKDINLSNLLSKKIIVIDSSSAHLLISNLVGRDKDNVIPIKSTPKTYLLEKIESKQADATLLDYPAAIKLIDEFEASESDTSFIVTPLHFKDFALQNESIQEHFIDNYAIPMHESQDEFIGLVNSNLSKIEGLIISIFDKHIKIDESQYPEKPFEFSKVQ
ncbi:MAG: transporter substrate-binding domain-containing protein [Pseudomonadales bacterium]|nr:transporter substrate-binding domain-containing protein [Pseudomonadales bacterium]